MPSFQFTEEEKQAIQSLVDNNSTEELSQKASEASAAHRKTVAASKRSVMIFQEAYSQSTLLDKVRKLSSDLSDEDRGKLAQLLAPTPIASEELVETPGA